VNANPSEITVIYTMSGKNGIALYDGKYLCFVGNFMCFPAVKNCENLLILDTVTADYKAVPFFSGHCVYIHAYIIPTCNYRIRFNVRNK